MRLARRRSKASAVLFAVVLAVLMAACVFLLVRAGNQDRETRYLASLTPTPSAVPKKVSYIYDSQTPSPTKMKFGTGTRDAVIRFQEVNGLDRDGVVGEETYRMLMSSEALPCPTAAPN